MKTVNITLSITLPTVMAEFLETMIKEQHAPWTILAYLHNHATKTTKVS